MGSNLHYQASSVDKEHFNSGILILSADENSSSDGERLPIKENTTFIARQGSKRFYRSHSKAEKRKVRRLIKKSGKLTLIRSTIPYKSYRYFLDLGNTLVNSRWRWTLIFLASCFVITWLLFACFWMLISNSNGDLDVDSPSETPCLSGINGFAGFFLFSIETQATIGYGSRYINHNCPEGTFLMVLQIIMGSAICGGMVSIVYVKMARPLSLQCKKLFSTNAVICQRDGILCLIFRIRDEDNRHVVGTTIDAYIVENREHEPVLYSIALDPPGVLIWPLEIVHKITPTSPFWDFSAKDLIYKKFEMIVTMQGTSVTTGQCSKTRTSYLSTEILWGRRFKPCVKFDYDKRAYYVDHKEFNETEEVLTPLCSAQRMEEVLTEIQSPRQAAARANIFNFDNLVGGMEQNRLQARRSTVVLTEINKSTEILDSSDSEQDFASPEILISHAENLPIPSLDYNSTKSNNNNKDVSQGEARKQSIDHANSSYPISSGENPSDYQNKKLPKRKISFGTKDNVTHYTPDQPISQNSQSSDLHFPSYENPSSNAARKNSFLIASSHLPKDLIVNSCIEIPNIINTDTKTSPSNPSAISLPNLNSDLKSATTSSSSKHSSQKICTPTPSLDETCSFNPPTIVVNACGTTRNAHFDKNFLPDKHVVQYLDEIKSKVLNHKNPSSQTPRWNQKAPEIIDVEELIDSLEKYVLENSYTGPRK